MKISNSKKELARIISENGGWRDGAESAAQCKSDNAVSFYRDAPDRDGDCWWGEHLDGRDISQEKLIANWHQTILSRDEYLHLYPTPDADGWIEWSGGECPVEIGSIVDVKHRDGDTGTGCHAGVSSTEPDHDGRATAEDWSHIGDGGDIIAYRLHRPEQVVKPQDCESVMRSIPEPEVKPTIEQLAADYRNLLDFAQRKQQEADDAKADADARLKALELAGEALGLLVSPTNEKQEPEMVITDWRDLQVGDEIEYLGGTASHWIGRHGAVALIDHDDDGEYHILFQYGQEEDEAQYDPRTWMSTRWCNSFRFIRRP